MSKRYIFSVMLAMGLLGASANAQEPRPAQPSTHPAEGTAADRTQPGETPTRNTVPPQPTDPRPATSPTEGTAADRTPPGRTPTVTNQGAQGETGTQGREMIGAAVVSSKQAPVGRVVDMVFDAANQPEFVVIESAGKTVAVPYSVANANKSANKIVIDESRLQGAPKIKQGEWRSQGEGNWKKDSSRYWNNKG